MNTSDYKRVLSEAISNEIEAYEFYQSAAAKSESAALKAVFTELAEEEIRHRTMLEAFVSDDAPAMRFSSGADYKVAESVELPELSPYMSFIDGIALAMKKEEAAMAMYRGLAEISTDPEQKNMFMQLSNMERMHKAKLEDLYSNTAYVEAW